MRWLLGDGSSLIFRAFYGVPASVRAPDGHPVNAIRGFLDVLARLIAERRPGAVAIATDEDWRPGWRVELIPSYKAHRVAEPVPPGLIPQMPVAYDVLTAIGIPVVRAAGYEAEDVIASLLDRIDTGRDEVEIASGDRDLFALVRDPNVRVLYPEGGGRRTVVDEAEVERRYGIPGTAYGDYAALRGDPSDGLPGVSGVGDKKAAGLIRRYGSAEAMLAAGALRERDADYLRRALRVGRPTGEIRLSLPEPSLPRSPADPGRLVDLSREHGLDSSIDRLLRALGVSVTGPPGT